MNPVISNQGNKGNKGNQGTIIRIISNQGTGRKRGTIREEFIKIGEKEENIHRITETALISHINKLKAYKDLLRLEGKAKWEGNLDELKENRI